jgi:hypothetical protein
MILKKLKKFYLGKDGCTNFSLKNVKDCFPYIKVALKMYLLLLVNSRSGERSF